MAERIGLDESNDDGLNASNPDAITLVHGATYRRDKDRDTHMYDVVAFLSSDGWRFVYDDGSGDPVALSDERARKWLTDDGYSLVVAPELQPIASTEAVNQPKESDYLLLVDALKKIQKSANRPGNAERILMQISDKAKAALEKTGNA